MASLNSTQLSLRPDTKAESAFFKLDGKKGQISDRDCWLQKGLKSISLRDPGDPSDNDRIIKATEHVVALLHKSEGPQGTTGSPSDLPRAEDVFRELLQRKGAGDVHPNGISSLMYAFVCLLDLSVRRPNNAGKQAMFDLSSLYGGEPSDFDEVRLKDGSGMLSPDCFFDSDRVMFLPRASSVLLILFNRNHNYIARRLSLQAGIPSETTVRKDPSNSVDAYTSAKDDEIFKFARYINCIHFRNILMEDIIKPLMAIPSVGPSHNLDLLSTNSIKLGSEAGASSESTILYDWSAMMSKDDIAHVESIFQDFFGVDADEVDSSSFDSKLQDVAFTLYGNRRYRNYAGLQRGKDGRFLDSDLEKILYDATECVAGSTRQGIPSCQKVTQIKMIEQARALGVCSLNDYRQFLGLKPLRSFEEWTSNKAIAASARDLYKSIDNLELFPGLEAEEKVPGAGIQLGYTKTFGLLVDIVSRMRNNGGVIEGYLSDDKRKPALWTGDEFSTRPNNGSFGSSIPKLLQRTLPQGYPYNNIYGLFPLSIPSQTITLLKETKANISDYETTRPQRRRIHHLVTKKAISYVFNKPEQFPTVYDKTLEAFTGSYGYLLGFDDEERHDVDLKMSLHALIPDAGALRRYAESFAYMAKECVQASTVATHGSFEIDIARDVINAVCTRWVCETLLDYSLREAESLDATTSTNDNSTKSAADFLWNRLQPLFHKIIAVLQRRQPKLYNWVVALSEQAPGVGSHAKQGEADVHTKFAALYAFVFHNVDPENEWQLRRTALYTSQHLAKHLRQKLPLPTQLSDTSYTNFIGDGLKDISAFIGRLIKEFLTGITLPGQTAQTFLDRVVNANQSIPGKVQDRSPDEPDARVVANVMGLAIVAAVKYAKVCAQAVDFYMQDQYFKEREEIIRLSERDDDVSRKLLMGYIREAYRLNHPLGVWRGVSSHAFIPQGPQLPNISVEEGDSVFADFSAAFTTNDPSDPDLAHPLKIDPRRRTQGIQGFGLHKCPGIGFVDYTMPEIFKTIFRLQNIRRAPGTKGTLVQFTARADPLKTDPRSFVDTNGRLSTFPPTLVLQYDRKETTPPETKAQKRKDKWRVVPGKGTTGTRAIADTAMSAIVITVLLWSIFRMITYIMSLFGTHSLPPMSPSAAPSTPSEPPPACLPPTSSIQPWEITTMKAGDDGKLIPIEYTLDHPTAHSISLVDVDLKDMTVSFWLDNQLLGTTWDVVLNKSDNCGDNYGDCLNRGFSGGYIVVPKGKHTVRIQWAGVERPGPDGKIDWGEEGGRRLAWSRDSCAA